MLVHNAIGPPHQNATKGGWGNKAHMAAPSIPCNHETENAMPPLEQTPQLTPADPIRAERPIGLGGVVCRIVLDDVNAILLQYTPNLLSILHIHASNTDTVLDFAVTVLNNFELKRDAIQTENDFPAQ